MYLKLKFSRGWDEPAKLMVIFLNFPFGLNCFICCMLIIRGYYAQNTRVFASRINAVHIVIPPICTSFRCSCCLLTRICLFWFARFIQWVSSRTSPPLPSSLIGPIHKQIQTLSLWYSFSFVSLWKFINMLLAAYFIKELIFIYKVSEVTHIYLT